MTAALTPTASASGASAPATRVKSSEYGYPQGHLGHLNAHEAEALEGLRVVLEERGLWRPGPPASHDDATLLRFLRARKWVVGEALKQFEDTEEWRAANNIDTLYKTIQLDAYEQSRRLYPQWTGRRDRRGIPLYVFEVKSLDSKTVSEYERAGAKSTFSDAKTDGKTAPGLLRLFALYENLTRFSQPLCTQLTHEHPNVPITMSTNIVDISGVGLKQFWNLKGHMQAASQLATAHYPETLDRIFIVGAPGFFSTVWEWIKRWFDPITVSKIFVLSPHEVKPTLEAYIEPRNIPKRYGGELDFRFGQLSLPDPNWDGVIQWEEGFKQFPTGPLLWETADDGKRLACVAYGTEDGKPRRQRVCTVPKSWPTTEAETNGHAPAEETTADATPDGPQTDKALTNGDAAGVS